MVTRYVYNIGLNVVDLTVILSGSTGHDWGTEPLTLKKRSSRVKLRNLRHKGLNARPNFMGAARMTAVVNLVIMMAMVVVVLARMNNLRLPEGGHRPLVAHLRASIILISLQRADHDRVYCCSRQGRHREPQILVA